MEKVIFTALTKQDLEALVIDCVLVCLKKHSAKEQRHAAAKPTRASQTHAQTDANSTTQKQAA